MGRVSLWALSHSLKKQLNLDFFFSLPWRSDTFAVSFRHCRRGVRNVDLQRRSSTRRPEYFSGTGDFYIRWDLHQWSLWMTGVSLAFHWGWSFHRIYLKDLKRAPFSLHLQLVFGPTYSRILVNDIATWTTLRCISYYQWGIFHCYVSLSEGTLKV